MNARGRRGVRLRGGRRGSRDRSRSPRLDASDLQAGTNGVVRTRLKAYNWHDPSQVRTMGAFWISRRELNAIVKDAAGYKSGLVLSAEEIRKILPSEYKVYWEAEDDHAFRIRAENFDDMFAKVLYGLGVSELRDATPATMRMYERYYNRPDRPLFEGVEKIWVDHCMKAMLRRGGGRPDIDAVVEEIFEKFGSPGLDKFQEIAREWNADIEGKYWNKIRRVEWSDTRELEDLFKSERLTSQHGKFFDQRFIDFLYRNFSRIDDIHWRQFEGFTCEYFEREGFKVEIGAGRGDGGVDARIWSLTADASVPPLILVQCKRQKDKVGKTIVKALYADVIHERADSGLIVTTSELSPGAVKVKRARGYAVEQAHRPKLKEWLAKMRTVGTGDMLSL